MTEDALDLLTKWNEENDKMAESLDKIFQTCPPEERANIINMQMGLRHQSMLAIMASCLMNISAAVGTLAATMMEEDDDADAEH